MEHSAVAGSGQCDVGTLAASAGRPFPISAPPSSSPASTSPSALLPQRMNYLVRAVFVRWVPLSSLPPYEMSH